MAEDEELEVGSEEGDLDPSQEESLADLETGEDDSGSEDVDSLMEMDMLKAMEEEGGNIAVGGGGEASEDIAGHGGGMSPNIARLMDVRLTVTMELGRARKTIQEILDLSEQSMLDLEKAAGDPVDVLVNGKLFARGQVVTVQEHFGVRITELLTPVTQL